MKKEIKGFVIGFMCALLLTGGAFAANSIMAELYPNNVTIKSNGQEVYSDNFTYNDRTYAPVREIVEKMNGMVFYDEQEKTVDVINKFYFEDASELYINDIKINNSYGNIVGWYDENENSFHAYFSLDVLDALGITYTVDNDNSVFYLNSVKTVSSESDNNIREYKIAYNKLKSEYDSTIATLEKQMEQAIRISDEDFNARGLYDSSMRKDAAKQIRGQYQTEIDSLTEQFEFDTALLKLKYGITD